LYNKLVCLYNISMLWTTKNWDTTRS